MSHEIKQLAIRLHGGFSNNQFDKVLELCHDDVEVHSYAFGAHFNGKEAFVNFMQGFKIPFPDVTLHHKNFVVEGNKVAVQMTANGTHSGPFQTPKGLIPATGKKIELFVSEFMVFENGKLISLHNYQDAGSLMQ